jgi:hypothetical protein
LDASFARIFSCAVAWCELVSAIPAITLASSAAVVTRTTLALRSLQDIDPSPDFGSLAAPPGGTADGVYEHI